METLRELFEQNLNINFLLGQTKSAERNRKKSKNQNFSRRRGRMEKDIMIMDKIALILTIIGGLNWGSIGLFRFDLVAWLFGGQTATVSRVVYTLVGLSAVWCVTLLFRDMERKTA